MKSLRFLPLIVFYTVLISSSVIAIEVDGDLGELLSEEAKIMSSQLSETDLVKCVGLKILDDPKATMLPDISDRFISCFNRRIDFTKGVKTKEEKRRLKDILMSRVEKSVPLAPKNPCRCTPTNKFEEHIFDKIFSETKGVEEKVRAIGINAYKLKLGKVLQDMVDLDSLASASMVGERDLGKVFKCSPSHIRSKVDKMLRKPKQEGGCGFTSEKEIATTLANILPTELQSRFESVAKGEKSSCISYNTYNLMNLKQRIRTAVELALDNDDYNEGLLRSKALASRSKNQISGSVDLDLGYETMQSSIIVRGIFEREDTFETFRKILAPGASEAYKAELKKVGTESLRINDIVEKEVEAIMSNPEKLQKISSMIIEGVGENCSLLSSEEVIKQTFCGDMENYPIELANDLVDRQGGFLHTMITSKYMCRKVRGRYVPKGSQDKNIEKFFKTKNTLVSGNVAKHGFKVPESLVGAVCKEGEKQVSQKDLQERMLSLYKKKLLDELSALGALEDCSTQWSDEESIADCQLEQAEVQALADGKPAINVEKRAELIEALRMMEFADQDFFESDVEGEKTEAELSDMRSMTVLGLIEGIGLLPEGIDPSQTAATGDSSSKPSDSMASQIVESLTSEKEESRSYFADYAANSTSEDVERIGTIVSSGSNTDSTSLYTRRFETKQPDVTSSPTTQGFANDDSISNSNETSSEPSSTSSARVASSNNFPAVEQPQQVSTSENFTTSTDTTPVARETRNIDNIDTPKIIADTEVNKIIDTNDGPSESMSRELDALNRNSEKLADLQAKLDEVNSMRGDSGTSANTTAAVRDLRSRMDDLKEQRRNLSNNIARDVRNSLANKGSTVGTQASALAGGARIVDNAMSQLADSFDDTYSNDKSQSLSDLAGQVADGNEKKDLKGKVGKGGRAPASIEGEAGGGSLSGGAGVGGKGPSGKNGKSGKVANTDKFKWGKYDLKGIIDHEMWLSDKEDILKDLAVYDKNITTLEIKKDLNDNTYYVIHKYGLKLTARVKDILGITEIKSEESRTILKEKMIIFLKDKDKYQEELVHLANAFVEIDKPKEVKEKMEMVRYLSNQLTLDEVLAMADKVTNDIF